MSIPKTSRTLISRPGEKKVEGLAERFWWEGVIQAGRVKNFLDVAKQTWLEFLVAAHFSFYLT